MFYFPNVSAAPRTTLQETDPGAAEPQHCCLLQPSPQLATGADPARGLPFSPKFPLLLQSAPSPAGQEQGIHQGRAVPQPRCCRGQKDGTLPCPHVVCQQWVPCRTALGTCSSWSETFLQESVVQPTTVRTITPDASLTEITSAPLFWDHKRKMLLSTTVFPG